MNSEKVQTIITEIISDLHARIGGKAARKQYPVSKHQIQTLTELGIIDLMPKGFGHSDAKAVIEEAQRGATSVMDSNYEGSEVGSSKLYDAINEVEITPEPIEETETIETVWTPATHSNIKKGAIVRTKDHTRHDYQVHGSYATLINPRVIDVRGGRIAEVYSVYVNQMEDEHGNPVNEYAIETTIGMFSLDELEVCTQITVTELATLFIDANPDSKLQTVRAYIKAEIARGNLPATMLGNQYTITTQDAAKWLANPKRGSRA